MATKYSNGFGIVSYDSGEIIELQNNQYIKVVTQKEIERNAGYYEMKSGKSFDSFYFNNYTELLEKVKDDYALAFRFLYLCTYANYQGILMKGTNASKSTCYMTESDFVNVFNMSPSMITKVKKDLYANELITNEDNKLHVNLRYCYRGDLPDDYIGKSTRTFDNGIRDLYFNASIRDHRSVGVVIPLLPYMHYYNNVLCQNPSEPDRSKVIPLTIGEICKITNYQRSSYKKVIEILLDTKINDRPLLAFMITNNKSIFVVNPNVFYKGNNTEHIECIKEFFGYLTDSLT